MPSGQIISSRQNARIKHLRCLARNPGRHTDWFLVEGNAAITEAARCGWEIDSLYHTHGSRTPALQAPLFEISESLLRSVSSLESPPGVLAVVKKRSVSSSDLRLGHCSLLLDGIQDPGNVGTLLRSAAAFGVQAVLATPGTAYFFSPKVVRGATGTLFHLQLCENVDPHAVQTLLQTQRVELIAADSSSGEAPERLDGGKRYLLVLGHETSGVSARWSRLATRRVRIPMAAAAESLNVAVAGSILLYELARNRAAGPSGLKSGGPS